MPPQIPFIIMDFYYTFYVRPYLVHIGSAGALVLALFLAYALLATSGDIKIYGAHYEFETWRASAGVPRPYRNQTITLPYCHLARDTAAEIHWLQQARALTGEDALLNESSQKWRSRHCIVDAHAVVDSLMEGANALTRHSLAWYRNFSSLYAPRINAAILDHANGGRLLYPIVWMDDARSGGSAPRFGLVDHNVLCITLEEMTKDYVIKVQDFQMLEPDKIQLPCFCPIHLGIVGSGLHFIHAADKQPRLRRNQESGVRETPCDWNILVDVRPDGGFNVKSRRESVQRQRVLEDIFAWEKRVLLTEQLPEPVTYNVYATLQAYNLAPLLGAEHDFRLAASSENTPGERLLLADLPSMRVYTHNIDTQDNPNACFYYCQRLEEAVLGEQYDAVGARFIPVAYTPVVSRVLPQIAADADALAPAQVPLAVRDLTDTTRAEREKRQRKRQEARRST
jgi:hypothetical protein